MDAIRTIRYKFKFDANNEQTFTIRMNSEDLAILEEPRSSYPEWARLKYQKCPNCPLTEAEHEYCPIAKKLVGTIDFFCQPLPFKSVGLSVETPERTFSKKTDLKSAAVSLIGIYMATSGCPIMDKLRPMVRHHLPLATTQETTYRSIANYLIAQYLLAQRGKTPDWDLKNLGGIYDAIKTVNTHFRERLLKISREDHALGAILTLDAHAYYINLSLIGDTFYTIENLFEDGIRGKRISYAGTQEAEDSSGAPDIYTYRFNFNNNFTKAFTYSINAETLRLTPVKNKPLPSWTKLLCNQCPNCPLNGAQYPHCPAALSLIDTMEFLQEGLPPENVGILVETTERNFSKQTTLADGLNSMIGLAIAASGCPVFSRLKPLVRNHLPFQTPSEQTYRSLGMYLLFQKFSDKNKKDPDWHLSRFAEFYQEMNIASLAFCERLKEISLEENNLDMLINLEFFRKYRDFKLSKEGDEELQRLFGQIYG